MEISSTLQSQFANAITTAVTTSGWARFYTAAYALELATCSMNSPAFGGDATGLITMTITSPVEDTSPVAGVAAICALYPTTAATPAAFIVAMGVGTAANDVVMANTTIATTDTVQLSSLTIQVPTGTPS